MAYDPENIGYKNGDSLDARRNAIRFLIDDKGSPERYTDSELDAWLAEWSSVWQAAALLADKEIGAGVDEEDIGSATRIRYLRKMSPIWRARANSHQAPVFENIDKTRFVPDGQFRF